MHSDKNFHSTYAVESENEFEIVLFLNEKKNDKAKNGTYTTNKTCWYTRLSMRRDMSVARQQKNYSHLSKNGTVLT